jgi:uncharacterized membrane protein YcaP (DUF421 family)
MFDLAMPWWEFALRGGICYLGLLLLLRLAGKRSFGEMAPFDVVVLIIVGGLLRPAVTGNDHSMLGPFISIVTILLLDKLLGKLAASFRIIDRLLEGRSVLLAKNGEHVPGALQRHAISVSAFERELRSHGVRHVAETEEVRLEANGRVTMLKPQR